MSIRSASALILFTVGALSAGEASAHVTFVDTISNFKSDGGSIVSAITSVSGWFKSDNTSNVTVAEITSGGPASYTFTGRENGPGWSVTSAFSNSFTAGFRINPFTLVGGVANNVPVSLQDFIYDSGGTVTITERQITSAPEPSTWATVLLGFAGLGIARYRRGKDRNTALAAS